jgi:DNA-binding response OmpR family regulator
MGKKSKVRNYNCQSSLSSLRVIWPIIKEMEKKATSSILIVDDDPDIRGLVAATLEINDYVIHAVGSGEEAVERFTEINPDLAILDLMMPGMTGAELCTWIKGRTEGSLIPVLILTALNQMEEKVNLLDLGADEYLTKPFVMRELQAKVRVLLRIRALNLSLHERHIALQAAQSKLIEQERQLLATQLSGTAAHKLGQPLTAIRLNLHLVEKLAPSETGHQTALRAIRDELDRMQKLLEQLKKVDAKSTENYFHATDILTLEDDA